MRLRLRPGAAVGAVAGALLLVGLVAAPALAWHANVTVTARCLDGNVRVHYTVAAWEKDHEATVDVSYTLNGETHALPGDVFAPHHNQFTGHFDLPNGTTGEITITAVAHWDGDVAPSTDTGSAKLPDKDCAETAPTTTTVVPATTVADETATTVESVAGAETSAPGGGGALPFTGANTVPLLVAGLALLGGGLTILLASRNRAAGRHAR